MAAEERTIVLGPYKGLTAKKHEIEVTDAEVEAYFASNRQDYAEKVDVTDRGIEQGDIVTLDYVMYLNDKTFEGGAEYDVVIVVGNDSIVPGFDEKIEVLETGDKLSIPVTMPENYDKPRLAGKDMVFKVTIKRIQKLVFTDSDDEIKARIKAEIFQQKTDKADAELEDFIMKELIETSEIEIFDYELERELDYQYQEWEENMKAQGFLPEKYLKVMGSDEDKQKMLLRKDARNSLKTRIILEAVADAEGYEPSQAEIDAQIEMIASHLGMPAAVLKSRFDEAAFSSVRSDIKNFKAMELIKSYLVYE